jgi:hydrogenase maturation protein HypF
MLPYSPFHHMLFNVDPEMILVMTSGNTSEEPIAFRDSDAFKRLSLIADYFISNDREITGQSDDSVMFVTNEQPFFARRSRGFVPAPFESLHSNGDILAVGGDMKNAFALTKGADVILSQYLGDMSDPLTHDVFRDTLKKYTEIFSIKPAVVASDLHPAYLSAEFADELAGTDAARIRVQHHHAHIAALLEEHADDGPIVGVAFDGTGYGTDGKLWGSEIMTATRGSFKRLAHFSYFKLPGGESSIHDTWKIGLSLLWQKFGKNIPDIFADYPADAVIEMLDKNINCPETCSIGRLFDGIAAILGISREVSAEAEAATLLEEAALRGRTVMNDYIIPHHIVGNEIIISSEELVLLMADSIIAGFSSDDLALIFHRAIIATTVSLAFDICENEGINKVGLSGGAFQNRILLGGITNSLASRGIIVLNHCKAPCNDGCIALGQIAVARELMNNMQNAN